MSSFKRRTKGPSTLLLKGTKPWTGGIALTSTGLRDLDQILGGGQPLGTCVYLEEDRWSGSLAQCLVKYWCAEAVSQEHHLLIPTDIESESFDFSSSLPEDEPISPQVTSEDVQALLDSLPRNLHKDKQAAAEAAAGASQTDEALSGKMSLMALAEDVEEQEEQADAGLTIAWQYKSSVQRERMGQTTKSKASAKSAEVYCHSYDLQRRLSEQQGQVPSSISVIPSCCCADTPAICSTRKCGFTYYRRVADKIKALLLETPKRVVRLGLYHPRPLTLQVALPLLLAHIRSEKLPVVVLIAVQQWTTPESELELARRASDVVLAAESFASRREYPPPPEFRLFHGLLHVSKASTFTAATAHGGGHFADATVTKRPTANLYGLKRDRRKLHIELLHIPPEDYAQGGGSVGGGVRRGAGLPAKGQSSTRGGGGGGLSCASSGGSSPLDF